MDEDQAYRAMDLLAEADAQAEVQEAVFFAVADLLNLEVDLLFFDTTSTYFERDTEEAGEDDLRVLEENVRDQERARDANDLEAFYILDEAFHQRLCDLSRHPTVWSVSQRAKSHLNRVRRLSLAAPDYLPEMIAEHRQVLGAVAEHNADEAELALRYHLRQVLRELPRIRAERPDYFDDVA